MVISRREYRGVHWALVEIDFCHTLSGGDIPELGSAGVAFYVGRRGEHVGSIGEKTAESILVSLFGHG